MDVSRNRHLSAKCSRSEIVYDVIFGEMQIGHTIVVYFEVASSSGGLLYVMGHGEPIRQPAHGFLLAPIYTNGLWGRSIIMSRLRGEGGVRSSVTACDRGARVM